MENDYKTSRSQDKRNPSQKAEAKKPDGSVLDYGGSGFLRTDRVQLGFEI
jgi:hypothetical protein